MSVPCDRISLLRDEATGVEAIRARFAAHAYDLHRHDDWLIGITDHGVQDFYCRRSRQRSTPGRVILIEPGEAHDGQAGAPGGFAYSMVYLPQRWLRLQTAEAIGRDPGFTDCLHDNPVLGAAIRSACAALLRKSERLVLDAALDRILYGVSPYLGSRARRSPARRDDRVALRALERLQDDIAVDHGADALARAAGAANRFELARAFRTAYGTSPHAYLVQIRLLRARQLLAAGEPPSSVAAACGFADQSHLGRRFRGAYGVTPGAYRALCTNVPDGSARIA